jgi:hypothetical protein
MSSLADYIVLSDSPFRLPDGLGVNDLHFTLPGDFVAGTRVARPILAYILRYESEEGEAHVWINPPSGEGWVRDNADHTLTWSGGRSGDQGLWESIQGDKLDTRRENLIIFGVTKGRARFRDVVLWFQRGSGI